MIEKIQECQTVLASRKSDDQKLYDVFQHQKAELRKTNPQLYYALLGWADAHKLTDASCVPAYFGCAKDNSSMETTYKNLWFRAGVTLHLTDEEADKILGPDLDSGSLADVVRQIISEGRFKWDGNSYIPEEAVFDFNEKYGADYDDLEPEWDF